MVQCDGHLLGPLSSVPGKVAGGPRGALLPAGGDHGAQEVQGQVAQAQHRDDCAPRASGSHLITVLKSQLHVHELATCWSVWVGAA